MDAERQPLLGRINSDLRCRFRPLTRQEVLAAQQEVVWRRVRFCAILMFWAIMAMFLSMITSMLMTSRCYDVGSSPTVPPVHMSFAPLLNHKVEEEYVYTL